MHNTVAGRNNSKVFECFLTPLEESKALLVTVELNLLILFFSISVSSNVDLHGVINDEINLAERVYFVGVTSKLLHSCTHSGQVNNSGHTCEVLKDDTGRLEGHFNVLFGGLFPVQNVFNIGS